MVTSSQVRVRLQPYLPRLSLEWLATEPERLHRRVDGSMVFVDISGFTALSEKLAKLGRVGAEEMADAINTCFSELLVLAYAEDGGLLKFGGDALLLLFSAGSADEDATRAARAAIGMRKRLREVGLIQTPGGRVKLRMSVGVHTGAFDFFLVGDSHRELIVTGPAATEVVTMEGTAGAGEIVMSPATASHLPRASVGDAKGPGIFLRSAPAGGSPSLVSVIPDVPDDLLMRSVPVATRDSLLSGVLEPEHRQVAVGFIHFDGMDELIEREGPASAAQGLDRLVRDTQAAVDELEVCFLASDVDADGGKLILTAGAPRAVGDDEERILLALRRIVEQERTIPIRIGVNHGPVFAGDIGPHYRRTYTVMGDTVNLAARLMAKAGPGEIYASGSVLERSATRFQTSELEPFMVKGKAKPVQAWSVGTTIGRPKYSAAEDFPLLGRREEMALIRAAQSRARDGERVTLALVGEAGVGKTRLLDEMLKGCGDFRFTSATGETFTAATPYVAWRDVLRELIGVRWEDPSEVVAARLLELAQIHDPSLVPWLPLIGVAADAEMPSTPEVDALGSEFRRTRLHEVVIGFLRALLVRPTLFAFEDAHLMDEASADLLTAIVTDERIDRPWLILALRRGTDGGFAPPTNASVSVLELAPIAEDASTALAEVVTDDAPLPGHVLATAVERAAGNPQLLLDLIHAVRTGDGSLPDSVESAATVRIDSLTPHDKQLVRRASVFGLAFHPRFLGDVLDEGTQQPDDATWERLAEFFEQEAGGYLRFRRAVIRDAAYAGLPFRTRQRLHMAVGLHFEREVSDPEENAGLLSLHFSLGAEYERAWRYSRIAASRAAVIYANVEAALLFERALDAGRRIGVSGQERLEIVEAHGEALWRARLYAEALRANAEARALAKDDALRSARLVIRRSEVEEKFGRFPQVLRWLSNGRRLVEGRTDREALAIAAEIDARYSSALQAQGRNREALAVALRAIEAGRLAGSTSALGDAENMLAAALAILGKPGAIEHWGNALRHFEESGDLPGQAMVLSNLGAGEYWEGRWSEALELYRRAQEASERLGDPVVSAQSKMNIAEVLVDQGSLQEAESLLRETSRVWRATGDDYLLGFCLTQLGRIAAMTGRTGDAVEQFEQARETYRSTGAPGQILEVDAREVESRLLAGEGAWALGRCREIIASLEVEGGVNVLAPLLDRLLGYALLQTGDIDGAADAFERGIASARERGAEHDAALSMQGLARIARMRGEPAPELEVEAGASLERLGIRGVPAFPVTGG